MEIWAEKLNLLSEPQSPAMLMTVDAMVGHEVSRVFQFLEYVRGHCDGLSAASVTNLLRLILMNSKYCQYPDLDKLIVKVLQVGSARDGSLLIKCMAGEALRGWIREMRALMGPNGRSATHDQRQQAASILIDSMEQDPGWHSASNVFAARLKEPVISMPTIAKQNQAAPETPAEGLSTSESEYLLEAMQGFSQLDRSVTSAIEEERDAVGVLPKKRDREQGQDHTRTQKKPKPGASGAAPDSSISAQGEGEADARGKKALSDAISRCAAVRLQVEKVSSGRSGAQSARQIGSVASTTVRALVSISSFESAAEQARCLATLMLWRAGDELLEAIAGLLVASDEANSAALVCFLSGAILLKVRVSQTVASRVLVRVLETVARARVDLVIDCVIAPSVALWPPLLPHKALAARTALGIGQEQQLVDLFARKNALELALRLARSLSASVGAIFKAVCDQKRQLVTPREAHQAHLLDAFLSPVAICCAFGRIKTKNKQSVLVLSAQGSGLNKGGTSSAPLSATALDSLLETAWKGGDHRPPSQQQQQQQHGQGQGQGRDFVDAELLRGLASLVLVAPPRGLTSPALGAMVAMLETTLAGKGGGGEARSSASSSDGGADSSAVVSGPTAQALCTLLSALLSRHRAEAKQAGLVGRLRVLASLNSISPHAQGVLRLLEGQ